MPKKLLLLLSSCFLALSANSQISYSRLYTNDFSLLNPAYIGMLETNRITAFTSEVNNPDFHLGRSIGRASISLPVSEIHSSVGLHTNHSNDGMFSTSELGILYSFSYDITEDIKVSLGTSININRQKIIGDPYYDPWDPIPAIDRKANYIFKLDAGLWIRAYGFQLGFCTRNINKPSIDSLIVINPIMSLILNHETPIAQKHTLSNSLLLIDLMNFSRWKTFIINNQIRINNTFILGITSSLQFSDEFYADISPNIGINLSNRFDLIVSYSLIEINPRPYSHNIIEAVLNYNF